MKHHNNNNNNNEDNSKVVEIKRVSKKTKGGNKSSFTALVIVGDKQGSIGLGLGKAPSVVAAIKKGTRLAQKRLVKVPIISGTIPYRTTFKFKAAKIFLKPAPKGTGIIAGGTVRSVVELAGITDIVAKRLGSTNKANNVITTIKALQFINKLYTKHSLL